MLGKRSSRLILSAREALLFPAAIAGSVHFRITIERLAGVNDAHPGRHDAVYAGMPRSGVWHFKVLQRRRAGINWSQVSPDLVALPPITLTCHIL